MQETEKTKIINFFLCVNVCRWCHFTCASGAYEIQTKTKSLSEVHTHLSRRAIRNN